MRTTRSSARKNFRLTTARSRRKIWARFRMDSLDLTLQEVLSAVPGRLLHAEISLLRESAGHGYSEMVFDSRKATAGCIFLCFKGERADGHDFVADVVKQGCKL